VSNRDFMMYRPEGFVCKNEDFLVETIKELIPIIEKGYKSIQYDILRLPKGKVKILAAALVEFAEDLHNNIGIWNCYEEYNKNLFGTPLPLTTTENGDIADTQPISNSKVFHFLWVLYAIVNRDLLISPQHNDLFVLTEIIAAFLRERFRQSPKGSEIIDFFAQPNEFGWDIKKKLLWLGRHSYFFRHCYFNYISDSKAEDKIGATDDFVCQETTEWSGLGVTDVLARLVKISESQRNEIISWYERHWAYYKIEKIGKDILGAVNLINRKRYKIRVGDFGRFFIPQNIFYGGLVPWNKEWYWSGSQRNFGEVTDEKVSIMRNTFIEKCPTIVYRYCEDLAENAREREQEHYRDFVAYHQGKDLVIYPDGLSMAADEEKHYRMLFESKPKEMVEEMIKRHKLKGPKPTMSFPSYVLECNHGVAVFFNDVEGEEIFINFFSVISGFEKKGIGLTDDEKETIREFLKSDSISPNFVNKLVQQYGTESIGASFLVNGWKEHKSNIDYLLRRYKGHFYRKRFPNLSFVLENE
jgi:hypothetical protein